MGGHLWTLVVIAGPVILAAAIAWAMLRNKTTPAQDRRTEEATRVLYRDGAVEDDAGS